MLFLYFSETGNTKYCMEYLADKLNATSFVRSIEESEAIKLLEMENEIVLGYPVYYSNLPKIMQDFMIRNSSVWNGKSLFLVASQGAFSGDGTGVAARQLKKYGARITGGLHLTMPDCILDVKLLKKTNAQNRRLVQKTKQKMDSAVTMIKSGKYPQEGLHFWNHIAGLFGQRLYFSGKTREYTDKLKIDLSKCVLCGKCSLLCPMHNITIENARVLAHGKCTMCYRCISNCPSNAITLIGKKKVAEQFTDYD